MIKELKQVAKDLNKLTSDLEKPHAKVTVTIAETLKVLENKLWKLLIKVGKAAI